MTAAPGTNHVLIVEPDPRVRGALACLVESSGGLAVLRACATADEAEEACRDGRARVALVGVRAGPDQGFAAVTRLARHVPVVAVAPVGSAAGRAFSAGAAAFYDADGDADALLAAIRAVIDRSSGAARRP